MAQQVPERYELRCEDPGMNGRPCWLQKVKRAKDLYIAAQAKHPEEEGFPYVQTLLVTISADGELCEHGTEKTLGVITTIADADGKPRGAIEWVDGTGVIWVEAR